MRSYRSQLRKHLIPTFGAMQLRHITRLTVRDWVAATLQALQPETVPNIHATLRGPRPVSARHRRTV